MVESHLHAGRQDLIAGQPLHYGQSITDGCVDWQTSLQLLEQLAASVERRGAHVTAAAAAVAAHG
jgi:3-deoxy-7-phosphoheptulonate synthase